MSRKSKGPQSPQLGSTPLDSRIEKARAEGRTQQALELANQLFKHEPTAEHQNLLKSVILERARQLRSQGKPRDAVTLLESRLYMTQGDPAWAARAAEELAAAGGVPTAMRLAAQMTDPAARTRLLASAADQAMDQGAKGRDLLPEELRPQFDLVRAAFDQAEAGQDESARESLQGVSLQSPFLEWKLMLRGLLAFYQSDDARAVENWQRLSPDRLPAKVAAPLRLTIDPAFRAAQSPQTQLLLQKQADRLIGSAGAISSLRTIQAALTNPDRIIDAFRLAEGLVPVLRQQAPQVVPRLAACFFSAIVSMGEPEDVPRYQRIFGASPDDPHNDRLQALLCEHLREMTPAHQHWQKFERGIANNPGWGNAAGADPAAVAKRARALVWERMGHNAASVPKFEDADLPPFLRDSPLRPKALKPDAEACFSKALELAPDRLESHQTLFHYYEHKKLHTKALETGRRLLERFPNQDSVHEALGDLGMQTQNYAAALVDYQEASRKRLNRSLRSKIAAARSYQARALAEQGNYEQARAEYAAVVADKDADDRYDVLCKWAACEFKAGDMPRGEELLSQALADAGNRLAVAYALSIEVIRFKLPRVLKTRYDREFKEALAEPPTAAAAVAVARTAAAHRRAGVEYHGRQTHEKKILSYLEKARAQDFTEPQLEQICFALHDLESNRALQQWALMAAQRFPQNPTFLIAQAWVNLGPSERSFKPWIAGPLLERAQALAATLPAGDRKEAILALINDAVMEIGPGGGPGGMGMEEFADMFEDLFDSMPDGDDDDVDDWNYGDPFPRPKPKKRGGR